MGYAPEDLTCREAIIRYNRHFGTSLWLPTGKEIEIKAIIISASKNRYIVHYVTNRQGLTPQGYSCLMPGMLCACQRWQQSKGYKLVFQGTSQYTNLIDRSQFCTRCLQFQKFNKYKYKELEPYKE